MADKLTLQQFGQQIKAKYPDYASRSDEEIGRAMLEKYPEYHEHVQSDYVPQGPPAPPQEPNLVQGFLDEAKQRATSWLPQAKDVPALVGGMAGGAVAGPPGA